MAYFDVYKQISDRLGSVFSIHQYMPFPKKWDRITKLLPKLTPAGSHAINLDGRLDVVAFQVYEDPILDWILLLYNRIYGIGEDDISQVQKTINLTLIAGEKQSFDIAIDTSSTFTYFDPADSNKPKPATIVSDPTAGQYHVAIGVDPAEATITFKQNNNGSATIENVSAVEYNFQVTYKENEVDERLRAGQLLSYPGIEDVRALLQETTAEFEAETSGFARL